MAPCGAADHKISCVNVNDEAPETVPFTVDEAVRVCDALLREHQDGSRRSSSRDPLAYNLTDIHVARGEIAVDRV